jgi:hypothetical protein
VIRVVAGRGHDDVRGGEQRGGGKCGDDGRDVRKLRAREHEPGAEARGDLREEPAQPGLGGHVAAAEPQHEARPAGHAEATPRVVGRHACRVEQNGRHAHLRRSERGQLRRRFLAPDDALVVTLDRRAHVLVKVVRGRHAPGHEPGWSAPEERPELAHHAPRKDVDHEQIGPWQPADPLGVERLGW